jgi:hypothetical protein
MTDAGSKPLGDAKPAGDGGGGGGLGKKDQGLQITRLQMIEFLNVRQWWGKGQTALTFTTLFWISFMLILWMRSDVEAGYEVNSALITYIHETVAHPALSKVPPLAAKNMPVPCRCACRSNKRGWPQGPCGGIGNDGAVTELLDIVGTVPTQNATYLNLQDGGTDTAPTVAWDDIDSMETMWYWVRHGLVPALWAPKSGRRAKGKPGFILDRNLIVGGVRARQTRAKVADCDIAEELRSFYFVSCRSNDASAEKPDMTGVDPAFRNNSAARNAFAPREDGKGHYDAMLDIELPIDDISETMTMLTKYKWVDHLASGLEFSALMLNVEIGVYAYMQVSFTFPSDGGVVKKVRVRLLQVVDASTLAFVDFIPEIIWGILIVLLLRQELWQICVMCIKRRVCEYLSDFWNVIDWISIFFGVPIFFYWYIIALQTGDLSTVVLTLPRAPLQGVDLVANRETWEQMLNDATTILEVKYYHQLCLFWYTVILTFRFLKNFLTQQKLATFQMAFVQSFYDLWHFMLIFMAVLCNFILGGRILFGAELRHWSTFSRSIGTSVRMIMGRYEFDTMYEVAPISASIWFWLFILSVMFVLSNFLLAIIYDHWYQFRKLIGPTPTVLQDVREAWKDFKWRCEWRKELVKDEEYRESLNNPYDGLIEELMEASKVDEEFEKASRTSSLGCKLVRRRIETYSMEGVTNDGSEGGKVLKNLEIREMGADPFTAEHIMEECQKYVAAEAVTKSHLEAVRNLSRLVKQCREKMDDHCTGIEKGLDGEREKLWETLNALETSLRDSLENFASLRETGVDTLAPPLSSELTNFQPEPYKERMDVGDSDLGSEHSSVMDDAYERARMEHERLRDVAAINDMPPSGP